VSSSPLKFLVKFNVGDLKSLALHRYLVLPPGCVKKMMAKIVKAFDVPLEELTDDGLYDTTMDLVTSVKACSNS